MPLSIQTLCIVSKDSAGKVCLGSISSSVRHSVMGKLRACLGLNYTKHEPGKRIDNR